SRLLWRGRGEQCKNTAVLIERCRRPDAVCKPAFLTYRLPDAARRAAADDVRKKVRRVTPIVAGGWEWRRDHEMSLLEVAAMLDYKRRSRNRFRELECVARSSALSAAESILA